ncbi:Bax inhibitor-1/YccA family protein [Tenuifilum thalassicum]|uniref:Bax inhibitor-1/YccA family protein n=1 Tax=Tenuifilum thalassicum TaxID=2590900 RepID=A0A7D3XF32_9BACT|nr:Bax inhibitor-1/YccA family protein [Tenuifilum thalassicum]QKG79197.1 Bax inhibitor-1/YccA family protein [Tenuifilum thalassicum]
MNLTKSSNPALSSKVFSRVGYASGSNVMTLQGTLNKAILMLAIVILGASYTWGIFFESVNPASVVPWMMVGGIGGFITSLVVIFAPKTSPYTAPVYALLEGVFLGGISAFFASTYGAGIIMQAVGLTFAIFFLMLLAYRSGTIRATGKFKVMLFAATGAIALTYFVSFILGFFGVNLGFIHGSGTFGIIFSLIVVGVAALNIIIDLDFIYRSSAAGAPKYMEWYGAFGLMVTLIWLYIEILRLLAKLSSRD